jgi:large subunit ribosomal protein L25
MKSVSISGSPRANVGKKDAKASRRSGLIPCVIYGGKEQIHFVADEKEFKKLVYTPEVFKAEIKVGDNQYSAIMQEIQLHPISDKILHIDFRELVPGKYVTIELPVKLTGTSPGVRDGGLLKQNFRKLKVSAQPENFLENITVDISGLKVGQGIKIADLDYPGVKFLDILTSEVVGVKHKRGVVEEDKGAAAAAAPAKAAAAAPAKAAAPAAAAKAPAKK